MWEEVDCDQRNGRIIEYIVIISSNNNTYNITTTERYITVNDLVLGVVYNISIAAVNSIGSGPFRELNIVTGIIIHNCCPLLFTSTVTTDTDRLGTTVGLSIMFTVLTIALIISNVSLIHVLYFKYA